MSWVLIATIVMSVSAMVLAIAGAVITYRGVNHRLVQLEALNREIDRIGKQVEATDRILDELEKER